MNRFVSIRRIASGRMSVIAGPVSLPYDWRRKRPLGLVLVSYFARRSSEGRTSNVEDEALRAPKLLDDNELLEDW